LARPLNPGPREDGAPGPRAGGVLRLVGRAGRDGEDAAYAIELTRGADPNSVLRAAFDAGLHLSRFENANASLHDIFVALVGAGGATPDRDAPEAAA